ncbi:MAG: hypothetical protein R2705_19220 [Ilumatobacteraceae bacterium]
MTETVLVPSSVSGGIVWSRSCSRRKASMIGVAASIAFSPSSGSGAVGRGSVDGHGEGDAALVPVHRGEIGGFGHHHLVDLDPSLLQPLAQPDRPGEPPGLLADGSDDQHGRIGPHASCSPGVEKREEYAHRRLGVERAPSPHVSVLDPTVERRVGHVLDGDRVEVDVDEHDSFAAPGETPVDVGSPVEHLVQHDLVGAEGGEARCEMFGQDPFADRSRRLGARPGVERVHARDPNERGDGLGELLGRDVHARLSHLPASPRVAATHGGSSAFRG